MNQIDAAKKRRGEPGGRRCLALPSVVRRIVMDWDVLEGIARL